MVGGIPAKGIVRQAYPGKFVDRFPELPTVSFLSAHKTCHLSLFPTPTTLYKDASLTVARPFHCLSSDSSNNSRRRHGQGRLVWVALCETLANYCWSEGLVMCNPKYACSEAGKLISVGETVGGCLTETYRPITPLVVKKFRDTSNPPTGGERIFYGRANDPDIVSHLTHGIKSIKSHSVASLANPPPKTCFQQKLKEKKESIYLSTREIPLGRSHDQSLRLPKGLDVTNTRFGVTTLREGPGGEVINPPKTFDEVQRDAEQGHELYVVTHNDYHVGEPMNRKYNPSTFSRLNLYGKETPHFNDGRNVARTLRWLHDLQIIADTLNVPPDHTFGVLVRPEEYGAGDLLHYRLPSEFLRGKDRERAVFTAIRQHLKKANYHNFDTLLQAFRHYDKDGDRKISRDDLKKACFQFNLDLDEELLDALFNYCDLDKDGFINYLEFVNFLNWKDKMSVREYEEKIITKGKRLGPFDLIPPEGAEAKADEEAVLKKQDIVLKEPGSTEKTPRTLSRQTDRVFSDYRTTSSQYNAVVGGIPSAYYPLFGVPSVRADIPAPRFRRISDNTNYGDQASTYALLYPSIYSNKGVYEKDFFKIRSKEEIARILRNIGVSLSDESFDEVWRQACLKDHRGEVCVESIRNVLDEMQAAHIKSR
ncbi:EF-hand domain-containing family member B isoform X2 [Rhineura floridana]|uniref:EF-hand domain-containing family member B isoform X2 n=1 Tax=Rhineura floridana TaxID=261503 RepID=UPI002AC81D70|nr:EF-hand domain-containing family member B isoform X2 [Rhineura floridana]